MNVGRLSIRWLSSPTDLSLVNVLHVKTPDSWDPLTEGDLAQFADQIYLWFVNDGTDGTHEWVRASNLFASEYRMLEIERRRIEPTFEEFAPWDTAEEPGTAVDYTWPTPGFNTTSKPLPPQCAVLASLETAIGERHGRGRIYWPATYIDIDAPLIDPGHWSDADLAAGLISEEVNRAWGKQMAHLRFRLAHALDGFYDDDGVTPLCVYSDVHATNPAVSHIRIADYLRTQRRRAFHPSTHSGYDAGGDPD